ncbi:MAG: hypothetical protein PWP28_2647 [Oceanotoga sp.]|jgi:hypothetical protein|uniref:Uncharacterized protein n=1 Tax=Oceanotoga teriensis TaxID=515440 RepID=A0AA45C6G6_9BACT|nr:MULTISPECIES: hypothetical protein [Oceanotoga]MDN5343766.1 hypothetical protein [Oceanotoga sp.]PWJ92027.1 hypothetical protein C7380_11020 [Oceanotoga teriensis]
MVKTYLGNYLESLSESQIEFLAENKFIFYERNGINRFRKEFKSIDDLKNILKSFINLSIIPAYCVEDEKIFYDFDEDNIYIRNYLIEDAYGKNFLLDILSEMVSAKDEIEKRFIQVNEIIKELSDDFILGINLWYKYGYSRLYISEGTEKVGFIDLINNNNFAEAGYDNLIEELSKDERVKKISGYFLLKEGLIKSN